jgi:hypothetical protein
MAVVELIVKYEPRNPPVKMLKLRFESRASKVFAAAVDEALNVSTASAFSAYWKAANNTRGEASASLSIRTPR